ncbi:ribosomal protein L7/L12 [Dongia deserti]|uniref:ribosomal protein L7/L12 n=1 Tax=Dongia deserti TaxID=2268030 RepID=UPI00254716C0
MLKYLILGIVILAVIFLVMRAFGRRPKDVGGGDKPKMIAPDGGAVAAEIEGQELDIDPKVLDEVRRLSAGGQKIEAIKLLREATGLGLADAKGIVDSLDRIRPK